MICGAKRSANPPQVTPVLALSVRAMLRYVMGIRCTMQGYRTRRDCMAREGNLRRHSPADGVGTLQGGKRTKPGRRGGVLYVPVAACGTQQSQGGPGAPIHCATTDQQAGRSEPRSWPQSPANSQPANGPLLGPQVVRSLESVVQPERKPRLSTAALGEYAYF